MTTLNNVKPLDDLELYDTLVAAYPERFAGREENGEELWDEVMEFADDICAEMGPDELCELIGRLVMLTLPAPSAIRGKPFHCMGSITFSDGKLCMVSVVKREVLPLQKEVANA